MKEFPQSYRAGIMPAPRTYDIGSILSASDGMLMSMLADPDKFPIMTGSPIFLDNWTTKIANTGYGPTFRPSHEAWA